MLLSYVFERFDLIRFKVFVCFKKGDDVIDLWLVLKGLLIWSIVNIFIDSGVVQFNIMVVFLKFIYIIGVVVDDVKLVVGKCKGWKRNFFIRQILC